MMQKYSPTVTLTAPADLCINAGVQSGLGSGTANGAGLYSGTGGQMMETEDLLLDPMQLVSNHITIHLRQAMDVLIC
jgi:hypothetical protein